MSKYTIHGNYYNNCFNLPPTTGPEACDIYIKKYCPADTQQKLWIAPVNLIDVEAVVESAASGSKLWQHSLLPERISFIKKYQQEIIAIRDELVEAICFETGKPEWLSKLELERTISSIDILIEHARMKLAPINSSSDGYNGTVTYRPIGPVLIITPFDYPCQIPSNRIVSVLLGGNTLILKPSEQALYTSQLLISCLHRAGFPTGVINMIIGGEEVGKRLVKYREIAGILFIGSNETGVHLLESARTKINKMLSLELSGKNTTILHKDCNVDKILDSLIHACYSNSGQNCLSTSLLALHKDIEDEFITKFHKRSKELIIDHPIDFETEPFMGPLINEQAVKTYLLFIGMAKREGVTEIMRGKQLERKKNGYYVSPSIHYAKKIDKTSMFLGSEILSPNCTIIPYSEVEEAINIANSTEFGLVTSIYTGNDDFYDECLKDIVSGAINRNIPTTTIDPRFPLGGLKNSGNFRAGGISTLDNCIFPVSSLSKT